jgi:2'-5' RNA ligase
MDLLGGHPAKPAETHRLFFALFPGDDVRRQLVRVAETCRTNRAFHGTGIRPDRYHATLHFLGDEPMLRPDLVASAVSAASKVTTSPFEWTMDYVASFHGSRPPCVARGTETPAPMQELWESLRRELLLKGFRAVQDSMTPHVTLGYGRVLMPNVMRIEPIRWRIDSFALVHSSVGQRAYDILGHWKFS